MDKIVKYYDKIADDYDQSRFESTYGKFIDKQERVILDKLLLKKEEVILDLACGSGRLLNYATLGLDASPKMVEIAKKKYPHKQIILSNAESTGIESNSIDTIICFHLFMHLDKSKTEKLFEECHRILKYNGRIIYDIPSKKRRNLFSYKSNEWHGANSISISELNRTPNFRVNRIFGILFFPIHRISNFIRKYLVKLDLILGNLIYKEYCSYLIVEFIKK